VLDILHRLLGIEFDLGSLLLFNEKRLRQAPVLQDGSFSGEEKLILPLL